MYAELNSEFVMRRANKVKGLGFTNHKLRAQC